MYGPAFDLKEVTSPNQAYLIILSRNNNELGGEMSALKYQLRELVSSLGAEANRIKNPEIKKHFYLIKAVVESKKDVKKTCEARGVSTDQFYMWAKRLLESKSLSSLRSLSKSAKSFWNKTPARVEKRVIKARKKEPFKGPERISFDLKKCWLKTPCGTSFNSQLKLAGPGTWARLWPKARLNKGLMQGLLGSGKTVPSTEKV